MHKRETSRSSESCSNRRRSQVDNIFQQKRTDKLACEVELGKLLSLCIFLMEKKKTVLDCQKGFLKMRPSTRTFG